MPFAHAEMCALSDAGETLGAWRFDGCTLYVTLEPCPMCAGAIVQTRVSRVVFGAEDPKAGAAGSLYNILQDPRMTHRCELTEGKRAGNGLSNIQGDVVVVDQIGKDHRPAISCR